MMICRHVFLKKPSRRKALALLLAAGMLAFLDPLHAQVDVPTIGVLLPSRTGEKTYFISFLQGLRELGYIEGKNIIIERRIAIPNPEQYAEFAAEFISLGVDVIVTSSTPATKAVKSATSAIPIVVAAAGDLVGSGLVASLEQPGGNVTGLSMRMPELAAARLRLLKEIFPRVRHVALFWNRTNSLNAITLQRSQVAAREMGLRVQSVPIEGQGDFSGSGFPIGDRVDALTAVRDSIILDNRHRIVGIATKFRLPAIYEGIEFIHAGGLASYATNQLDLWKRAATYVDRILKGANPADLPVEQPLGVEFVINLRAAAKTGLKIPSEIIQRANRVIK